MRVGGVADLVGDMVDAARRFAKEVFPPSMAGLIGEEGVPRRRLDIDPARDCVFTFSIGATVGAE